MRVLGISPLDKDATVSFLEDGRVVFACSEERLSRVKMQNGFPRRALQLGLERTGWNTAEIDAVAYAFYDGAQEAALMREAFAQDARQHDSNCTATSLIRLGEISTADYQVDRTVPVPSFTTERDEFMPPKRWYKRAVYACLGRSPGLDWAAHKLSFRRWLRAAVAAHRLWTRELHAGLASFGLQHRLVRVHHHDAHAANTFYASPFEEALVVTLDGYGSGTCGGVYRGSPGGLTCLHRFRFPNSLGLFYEHVTSGLGFRISRHEGKIVGLAAYGNPEILRDVLQSRFTCADGDILMHAACNHYFTRALAQRFAKRDIAAAYQRVLEVVACTTIDFWLRKTGLKHVAVSGGVHANVKLNQRIREINGVAGIFVYPNMGDGGCATGAAMLQFPSAPFARPWEHVYFGPDYSEAQCAALLEREGLAYEKVDDIEDQMAQLVSEERIVGRFHGRMEYGPRALGNRSILYPAHDPSVNQWLNRQLRRTEFMPFAPACLADAAGRMFYNLSGCENTALFMTITFNCTEEMKRLCPAAVHVDGTARPQLVSERTNAAFARILRGYYRRTGVPALINTSFNMHEEPIVCTPEDAIRAFVDGRLDYLAIENFLVAHPRLPEIERERRKSAVRNQGAGVSKELTRSVTTNS